MEKDKGRRISVRSIKKEAAKVRKSSWWRCGMSKGTFSGVKVTVFWVTYVLLGSLAFQYLEETTTVISSTKDHHNWARFKELAAGHTVVEELLELKESLLEICPESAMNRTFELLSDVASSVEVTQHNVTLMEHVELERVEASCGPALRIVEHLTERKTCSLVDAIYYTMTAVTTIGYGHIYPTTPAGRIFCVLYCLVGVPLTCILLAKSTDLLSSRMERVYITAKRRHRGMGNSLLYWVTTIYLSVGFLVFMLLPSLALTKLEPWTLEEALYLTFITLTTIGFGDFYPGYEEDAPYKEYQDLYKMGIVIWIMVALGYWFLLLNFLQKVLRKHVPRKLKKSLKKTRKFKKQSEFFQQLVSKGLDRTTTTTPPHQAFTNAIPYNKVVSQAGQQEVATKGGAGGDKDIGVVALMVEVADALTSDEARRPSINMAASGGRRESRAVAPITLAQLLDVRVAVRGEAIPSIRSFVATSPHPSSSALQDLLKQHKEPRDPEVTLPLREVLTLVSLIKSVEDQVGGGGGKLEGVLEGVLDDGMTSSTPSSPMSTATSCEPDYLPLIRARRKDGIVEEDNDDDDDDDDDDIDDDDDDEEDEEDDDEEEDEDEEDEEEDEEDEDEEEEMKRIDVEKGKRGGRFS
ncbi:hypothetical protein O3P69_013007 [Scylla paramamosain]|uniref:Potassium channel domain-containing protein n=1 Tax=Scylla paramamosain TaxID=85552 RepID=A0AAW0TS63_SCYPA